MAIETVKGLIQTGNRVTTREVEQTYGFPIEILGFEDLEVVRVPLTDPDSVKKLLPDFVYKPNGYTIEEAVCVFENDQPVLAFIKGTFRQWSEENPRTGEPIYEGPQHKLISIANLADQPERVILSSTFSEPLSNSYQESFWPGYDLNKREKNLGLGLEIMSIKKSGDQFIISFPQVQEV